MASSTRLTTPPLSPGRNAQEADANLRRRSTPQPSSPVPQPNVNASPASSATASTSGNNISLALDPRPSLRLSALHSAQNYINVGTPVRKLVVRSDPSLVTCFDPADKELHDLWAPKR